MTEDILYIGHITYTDNHVKHVEAYPMDSEYAEETANILLRLESAPDGPLSSHLESLYRSRFGESVDVTTDLEVSEGDILSPDLLEAST